MKVTHESNNGNNDNTQVLTHAQVLVHAHTHARAHVRKNLVFKTNQSLFTIAQ